VAKVKNRAYRQWNGLIYRLLGFTGVLQVLFDLTGFFWVVFASFAADCTLLPLYAGPTYPIALTIVHSNSTSTLSLYTACFYLTVYALQYFITILNLYSLSCFVFVLKYTISHIIITANY
jgi:hypothetical protein